MYFGNNKVEIEDVPEPTVIDGHVKVKVSRNGICGTDLHEYYDGPIFVSPTVPHPLTGKASLSSSATSSPGPSPRSAAA